MSADTPNWPAGAKRRVEPVAAFAEEVLAEFLAPSLKCVEAADLLLEELEDHEPDTTDRCGLLADRYEVYALRLPGCGHYRLVISFDTSTARPWPATVHGLARSRFRPCDTGRLRAVRQLSLINPGWEPANE